MVGFAHWGLRGGWQLLEANVGGVEPADDRLEPEQLGVGDERERHVVLRGSRKVDLILQVFNLLNRTNLTGNWQTNARSPKFGVVESAGPMRQAEIAARFTF